MSVHGVRNVSRMLRGIGDRSANLTPIWPEVGGHVADGMARQFASGGAAGGLPWAPLNPDYLAWKVSKGLSPKVLIATGEMMASLTSRPLDIERYRPRSAEFGTSDEKYGYHHFGTENMAQRRALFWHEPMTTLTTRSVRRYIRRGR